MTESIANIEKFSSIEMDLLYGDKLQNDFLHFSDVFEKGKQIANYEKVVITGNINLEKISDNVKNALEKIGKNVVFVGIRNIDGERVSDPRAYIKPETQTVSTGEKFCLFKTILESLKYKVEVSYRMDVLSVSA